MEKGRLALVLLALVLVVGTLSFLKWVMDSQDLPRERLSEKTLRVLSYSVFVSSSGPAPELVKEFKRRCKCKVEFVTAGDAGLLLERLKLTQGTSGYDLVLGLDQFWKTKALEEFEWVSLEPMGLSRDQFVLELGEQQLTHMVPFDYAPLTFIYRKPEVSDPPQSLDDFLKPRFKNSLSLQDPRSSSPGLQFLGWVTQVKGNEATAFLRNLKMSIHSISPSWALSYGLFKKGQARFVFSYLTSLAFHQSVEKDDTYAALSFVEGHPIQIEYAGIPKGCKNCELAQDFIRFLLEPDSQNLIAVKNFMLPVSSQVPVPVIFESLPKLKLLPLRHTKPPMNVWDQAFQ